MQTKSWFSNLILGYKIHNSLHENLKLIVHDIHIFCTSYISLVNRELSTQTNENTKALSSVFQTVLLQCKLYVMKQIKDTNTYCTHTYFDKMLLVSLL